MPFVKVRQDGAITIPVEVRNKHSMLPGTWYEVTVNGKGRITLIPQRCQCSLCGANVTAVDGVTGTCAYCKVVLTDMVRKGIDLGAALKQMQKVRKNGGF